ncbi:MAG: glycosyltransferase [Patescibacteria group bacterium]
MKAITFSIIIPAYKRLDQTIKTINLLEASKNINDFNFEIIVSDDSPDLKLKKSLKKLPYSNIIYTRPKNHGVAANKNHGARIAKGSILIFCDSDIEVEPLTIHGTLKALNDSKSAAGMGGQVFWKKNNKKTTERDRPRKEDRILKIKNTKYIEAIYSRYFATYKDVFKKVGGYDEKVFNYRGEGSDLSIRYWQAGFPLTYEPKIKVFHVYEAPDSVALRKTHPEFGIAKDYFLLAYKYKMLNTDFVNFSKTIETNFTIKNIGHLRLLQGIAENLDFICTSTKIINTQKLKPKYNFKFLEIFSDKPLLLKCLNNAETKLHHLKQTKTI